MVETCGGIQSTGLQIFFFLMCFKHQSYTSVGKVSGGKKKLSQSEKCKDWRRWEHSDRQSASSASLMSTQVYAQRVKGQASPTLCLQLHGSIEGHELTLSAVCQTCLKLRPVNQTFATFPGQHQHHHHPVCLSVTQLFSFSFSSVFLPPFISPSFHTALSTCQSERGLVTPGEGCLAPVEPS